MNKAVKGLKVRADGLKERASESATYALGLSKRIVYTTLISTVTVALLANASAFMYATFYYAFVPSPEHEAFVNPTFEPCGPTKDSMLRCGFLNATGDVGGATGPVLMAGQDYTVTVLLDMPESPVNRKLGMFMSCLQLKSATGEVVREKCKSSMLQYRSWLLRQIETVVFAPFLLTGHTSEKQMIRIEFFDDYFDNPLRPAAHINFQVLSRYVEIYQIHYRIHANFSGVRHFMYRYPLLSAAMGTGMNFFVLTALALLAWFRFFATQWYKFYDYADSRTSSHSSSLASSDNDDDEEDPKKLQKEKKRKLGEQEKGALTTQSSGSKSVKSSSYGVILDEAVEDIKKKGVGDDAGQLTELCNVMK